MNIIAWQHDYTMTGVEIIEVNSTDIRFENGRYHQFWNFDSEDEAKEAFAEVNEEIRNCVIDNKNCILDEVIIKARVRARLNQNEEIK